MADIHIAKVYIEPIDETVVIWKWKTSVGAEDGDPTGERLNKFKETFKGRIILAGYDEFGILSFAGLGRFHHYLHQEPSIIHWEVYQD